MTEENPKPRAAAVIVVDRHGAVVETCLVDADRMDGVHLITRRNRDPGDDRQFASAQVISRRGCVVAYVFEERVDGPRAENESDPTEMPSQPNPQA